MSSPKRAILPPPKHVHISPSGRPYVDTLDVIRQELERIEKARSQRTNGNGTTRDLDQDRSQNQNTNTNGQG